MDLRRSSFGALIAVWVVSISSASAQSTAGVGHLNISAGVTIEPEGPVHSIDFVPKLGGVAPVITLGGGVLVSDRFVVDGDVSIAQAFSRDQRVRLGIIDFATTTAKHRDLLISAAILGKMGPLWGGGGIVFARSVTERVGVATVQRSGGFVTQPYSDQRIAWNAGFMGVATARGPISKSVAIVATMRVYVFNHNVREEGLSAWLVYRPTVGVDFRF